MSDLMNIFSLKSSFLPKPLGACVFLHIENVLIEDNRSIWARRLSNSFNIGQMYGFSWRF